MNEQPATKRPKFCPLCQQKKGLNNKLKLHQLNFVEAIYMCPNSECLFPLQGGLAESFLIKRSINIAQDFPAAASNPPENPVFPGLPPENIDNSFIDKLIEPSTSQPCENSTDIFDLVGWLENLGNNDLPSCADPPRQPATVTPPEIAPHSPPPKPKEPKAADAPAKVQKIICVKSVVANNTRQLSETTKEVKPPCKAKRKNVANASPTKLMTTDIVAATQLQIFPQKCDVIENTAEKRPVNSTISIPAAAVNRNFGCLKTYGKPRVQDATKKQQTAISLCAGLLPKSKSVTRKLSTQSEPQRNTVTPKVAERSQPVNNFLPFKSMSLKEIINSVTIKKRPQFFVDGGVGGGSTRADKRKLANLREKPPSSQVAEVLSSGRPAKRRKVDPVANEVPVSLKKVYGKLGKTMTMYEGYGVPSKIGPEDETASEDSGIQSPNSVASAGSGSLSGSR